MARRKPDYNIPKGLTAARRDRALFSHRPGAVYRLCTPAPRLTAAATTRFVEALLRDVFGFWRHQPASAPARSTSAYTRSRFEGARRARAGGRRPPSDDLDAPSAHLPSDGRRRSAASAVQDWLNASDGALWDCAPTASSSASCATNASLTRPAFIQADLRRIFEGEAFADFAALWLLIHASRFGMPGAAPTDCALERWREAGAKEGVAARERLRDGVEAALLSLGGGFVGTSRQRRVCASASRAGRCRCPSISASCCGSSIG